MSGSYNSRPGDWTCPKCKELIFASKPVCFKCKVNKDGIAQSIVRMADWNCPNCGDYQFARNKKCRKCSTIKPSHSDHRPRTALRKGDWLCPNCQDVQFSRNTHCRKCKTPNPILTVSPVQTIQHTEQVKEDDEKLCTICLDADKNMLLLHVSGTEGHLCCCETCANELVGQNAPCPICRQAVTQAIKVF